MPILKRLKRHRLLLDTHVFIWIMNDSPLLTKEFRNSFASIFKVQGSLLSPMSIWEIGMLIDKKRIEIDMDVLDWVNKALDSPGMLVCPISPRIAIQSTRLPGKVHLDPVDRLLIATAYEENAVLVTSDKKIIEYGKGRFISVFDPCKR